MPENQLWLNSDEAANFLEWAHFDEDNEYELRVHLRAMQHSNNMITFDIKAGPENADSQMDGNARELLKVTYLKPLRDAEKELTPGYRSRLAQTGSLHNRRALSDFRAATTLHLDDWYCLKYRQYGQYPHHPAQRPPVRPMH